MSLENEINKLKRSRKHGPVSPQERWEIVQAAARNGMESADLSELDYSLMSPDEQREADRIWAQIRLPQ
jgi:hypothetical protein